jgi:hypothetical protein
MNTIKTLTLCLIFLLSSFLMSNAQEIPEIGAQVWIEPGNTDQQIDHWFKTDYNPILE